MPGKNMNESEQKLWSDAETKLLISIRLRIESEFIAGRQKKSVLWGKVFTEMKTLAPLMHYNREDYCKKIPKFKGNLSKDKKRNKQSGRDVSSWDYFQQFDEVCGCRHNVELPNELVAEIFGQSDESDKEDEIPKKKTKQNDSKLSNNQIMEFLEKEAIEDERRHKEILKVEREKIEVEKKRIEVLMSLQETLERITD